MQVRNNETIASLGFETVRVCSAVDGVQHLVTLHDVIYVPEIMSNLIFIFKVRERNFRTIIDEDECLWETEKIEVLQKHSKEIGMVEIETPEGLFEAALRVVDCKISCVTVIGKHNLRHERLEHCGDGFLRASIPHICGIKTEELAEIIGCELCSKRKANQMPRKTLAIDNREAANSLERVFLGVVGPMRNKSIDMSRHFVTQLETFSGSSLVCFVDHKRKVFDTVVNMMQKIESLLDSRMRKMTCINQNSVK